MKSRVVARRTVAKERGTCFGPLVHSVDAANKSAVDTRFFRARFDSSPLFVVILLLYGTCALVVVSVGSTVESNDKRHRLEF